MVISAVKHACTTLRIDVWIKGNAYLTCRMHVQCGELIMGQREMYTPS
jgi:hypothetical protein